MTLKSIHSQSIPNGTKFLALYSDGSGARLFLIADDGHLYDDECEEIGSAPDTQLNDMGFSYWIELPNSYKFWFEQRGEE